MRIDNSMTIVKRKRYTLAQVLDIMAEMSFINSAQLWEVNLRGAAPKKTKKEKRVEFHRYYVNPFGTIRLNYIDKRSKAQNDK